MDNKNNELIDGIIDVPNSTNENNSDLNNQSNLEYNFDFELQSTSNSTPDNMISNLVTNVTPKEDNSFEVIGGVSQIETLSTDNTSTSSVEIFSFDDTEQLNEQGKIINHELLKNLAQDTNNLVNPDMINPLGKPKEEKVTVNVEEPKVDYDKINTKRNYVFMAIIFIIIIAFIILLPKLISIIGI